MQISALNSQIKLNQLSLDQLTSNSQVSEQEKVGELSRQFEAVMLRQILKQAQQTVIKSSFTDDSSVGGIYQDMVTQQMADAISESGAFGMGRVLSSQLTRQLQASETAQETSHE